MFPLDLAENLVGRRSDTKGIYPEVEVADPGVSHRHIKFIRQDDGGFVALDLGSANGTQFNGAPLTPGVAVRVKAGDELLMGLWTRLQLRSRGV
jgi:pSer/pThr/pTyr-binding forkhead associated (FHA) protein